MESQAIVRNMHQECFPDLISQDVGDKSVNELLFSLLRVLFGELGDMLQGRAEL